jgi:hypothetical protein
MTPLSVWLFKLLSKYGKPEVTIQQNGDLLLNEQAPVTMEFLRKHNDKYFLLSAA